MNIFCINNTCNNNTCSKKVDNNFDIIGAGALMYTLTNMQTDNCGYIETKPIQDKSNNLEFAKI